MDRLTEVGLHGAGTAWDEIIDGGLPEGATVQAWQSSARIAEALALGADVIASPQEWVYLNRQASELPLERVAQFSPDGAASGPGRILGGEAPLWAEHVTSGTNAELMWWPRLLGFAEAMWSGPPEASEFAPRVEAATERGIVVMLPHGRFAFNSADLPSGTMPMIDQLAKVLKDNPGRKIAIEGHTDSTGAQIYNKTLGRDRAGVVRAALIRHGVSPDRIIVRSYGEEHPVADNSSVAGRKENRRTDVLISDMQGRLMEPQATSSGASSGKSSGKSGK